jgi:SAM-dependent methyltransferase
MSTSTQPSELPALPIVAWRQWRAELRLRLRGIKFRDTDPDAIAEAYARMRGREFTQVNGRQAWANWRTIPRHLRRIDRSGAWRAIDLGCGQGDSTQVLAWCCPPQSTILAYDVVPELLAQARRQAYRHATGDAAAVSFRRQSITETWRDETGAMLPGGSVTLVNASGVLGHHLDRSAMELVAGELARVLAPGGVAIVDVGPRLPAKQMAAIMRRHGLRRGRRERSCALDPYGQIAWWAG